MRSRKSKADRKKDVTRFKNEAIVKCGECKRLFNGICEATNTIRYKNETSCFKYFDKI